MSNAGSALMGIGSARGEDRARAAAEMAVSSPLLEASIDGAHGVLLSIAGGSDLGLFEVSAAANLIQNAAHEDANIIFGTVIDDALGDEVRVTVIAAGFEGGAAAASSAGDQPGQRPAQLATGAGGQLRLVRAGAEQQPALESARAASRRLVRRAHAVVHLPPVGAGRGRRRPRRTGLPQVACRRGDHGTPVTVSTPRTSSSAGSAPLRRSADLTACRHLTIPGPTVFGR